jgi:hypothetical protein
MTNKYWKTDNIIYIGDPFGDAQELTESEYNQLHLEEQIKEEIVQLKNFLTETDYIYPKCLELGLDVNIEYESIVQDRKTARARIQELEGV